MWICKKVNTEFVIQIDSSETYSCGFAGEVQAIHFGGSHVQVTLHTGVPVIYITDDVVFFCTLSDSQRHDM